MTTSLSGRRSHYHTGTTALHATIDAAVEQERQQSADEWAAAKVEAAERAAARVRFTAAELADARAVRDRFGWHKVVRVSAKSVTVETGYSWTDRIALDKVLQIAR